MPAGIVTRALRRWDCEIPSFPSLTGSKGRLVVTAAGEGESILVVPGATSRDGSKGTRSQPVSCSGWPSESSTLASAGVEPSGKLGFGSSQDSARNQVEYRCGNSTGLKHVVGSVRLVPSPARPLVTRRFFRAEKGWEGFGSGIVKASWKSLSHAISVFKKSSFSKPITKPKSAGSPSCGTRL